MNSKLIFEGAYFQEAKVVHDSPGKAIFRMIMQDVDVPNQNRRIYPKNVLKKSLLECHDRMNRKSFYGEMDHPIPSGNNMVDGIRQSSVSLERVSHYIRDYEFKGNQMISECETASTPLGQTLYGLIRDKSGIGMSMRGMAELERVNGNNIVKDPLTIIAYDAVSLPSHKSAIIDFNNMKYESHMLTESVNRICVGGRCFLPNYFDKLVETRMITFFDRWV